MPYDKNLILQATTTATVGTATSLNSTALDLLNTPQGHEVFDARVTFMGSQIGTAAYTATFYVQESSDNTTFYQCSAPRFASQTAAGTVAQMVPLSLPFVRSQEYVRLRCDLSANSGLTIAYQSYLGIARP